MNLTPWFRKAGIELTRLCPWDTNEFKVNVPNNVRMAARLLRLKHGTEQYDNFLQHAYFNAVEREMQNKIHEARKEFLREHSHLIAHHGTDPCCYEVSSAILYDWKTMREFYTKTDEHLTSLGLLREHEDICGTGGHIHVSVDTGIEANKVKKLMLNHPHAMLAFAHPQDDHHPLENLPEMVVKMSHHQMNYIYNMDPCPIESNEIHNVETRWYTYNMAEAGHEKLPPISYRGGTIEYRMFDVATSLAMQEEHMAFAQAFTRYALTNPTPDHLMTREEVEALNLKDHIKNFKGMVKMLDLPWSRYKRYVDNIEERDRQELNNFVQGRCIY